MTACAVIDAKSVFRGIKPLSEDIAEGWTRLESITSCDLEAGKYKWDGRSFIPIGHGFGKPESGRIPDDYAVYLGLKAMSEGAPMPTEFIEWLDWYGRTIAPRHAEKLAS